MTVRFQITIDCADPDRLARFWAAALGYELAPPPPGHATWTDFYRSIGVPEDELGGDGADRIVDPEGQGPRFWFQQVPEAKSIKNRLHLDLTVSGGRATSLDERRRAVDAEVVRLTALGATTLHTSDTEGLDHYAVTMQDPEGNEFCIV